MNIGVTAIVSRRKGQGDRDGANECLAQAVAIALILGVVLCTAAIIVAEPLIAFAGADEDIFDDAVAYFRIIMAGSPRWVWPSTPPSAASATPRFR